MKIKKSKFNRYSAPFKEHGDERQQVVIFSDRKQMGVKLNTELFALIRNEKWSLIPDELFTLLMYYEILVHYEVDEVIEYYQFRMLLDNLASKLRNEIKNDIPSIYEMAIDLNRNGFVPPPLNNFDLDVKMVNGQVAYSKPDRKVNVQVCLKDEFDLAFFLDKMPHLLNKNPSKIGNILVKISNIGVLPHDGHMLQKLRLLSDRISLIFLPFEHDFNASDELYSVLLEKQVWGDYFF